MKTRRDRVPDFSLFHLLSSLSAVRRPDTEPALSLSLSLSLSHTHTHTHTLATSTILQKSFTHTLATSTILQKSFTHTRAHAPRPSLPAMDAQASPT